MSHQATVRPKEPLERVYEPLGLGLNVFELDKVIEGRIRWLGTPQSVIDFVNSDDDVTDVIVLVRGGTTTFLSIALTAGIRGVITLQGAPESHLGIVCREYGIPCIMSVSFERGVRTDRGEVIPADGTWVRMNVSERPQGHVSVEAGSPVVSGATTNDAPTMSPEQAAQIQRLLTFYLGDVPHGAEGDKIMQSRMKTGVLHLTDESVKRELTLEETTDLVNYIGWNEWDMLAARATEGESGLIPRQEYEAMGLINSWYMHPGWLAEVDRAVGVEGVIKIGRSAQFEFGTKMNLLHTSTLVTGPAMGRGIALELGLHSPRWKVPEFIHMMTVARCVYKGHWGDGDMFAAMRNHKAHILDQAVIERFERDRVALDSESNLAVDFQRFSGSVEVLGFLLHFDCRLGLGDSGPYPLSDGGFALVRDYFINEPAFPWSDTCEDLPHAVTQVMFFKAHTPLDVRVQDLSTAFTTPANYHQFIDGIALYTRQHWDTPIDEVVVLSPENMRTFRDRVETVSGNLYQRIARMSTDEKIRAGAAVYAVGWALPLMRAAGVYEELVGKDGFVNQIHPEVEAAFDRIIEVAPEMVPRQFLTSSWNVPFPASAALPAGADEASLFQVLHALRIKGLAGLDDIVAITGLESARVEFLLSFAEHDRLIDRQEGQVKGWVLTRYGNADDERLLGAERSADAQNTLSSVYTQFLPVNAQLKETCTAWQLRGSGINDHSDADYDASVIARLEKADAEIQRLLGTVTGRFGSYATRFSVALKKVRAGDRDAFAKPMSQSYHDIWMELHQDLLVTLGLDRSAEDGD
jgi:hypothetical protein